MVVERSAIERQAAARLLVIKKRIAKLADEQALIERILEDNTRRFVKKPIQLRRNSLTKLAIESQIRLHLRKLKAPAKAQQLFDMLIQIDPELKPATFRSHIKRLADAGVIVREGSRGTYRLVPQEEIEDEREKYGRSFRWRGTQRYE